MPFELRNGGIADSSWFSPCQIPGCILWVPVDKLVYANNASVPVAADFSGNGNNLVQATGSARPTFLTNQINGLPALSFNGSSDYLACATPSSWGASGATIFLVIKPAVITSYIQLFSDDSGNGGYHTDIHNGILRMWDFSGNLVLASSVIFSAGVNYILSVVQNGASSAAYVKGALLMTGLSTNGTVSGFNWGVTPSTAPYDGLHTEVIVYNAVLTSAQRHNVEAYLASKYQISVVQN